MKKKIASQGGKKDRRVWGGLRCIGGGGVGGGEAVRRVAQAGALMVGGAVRNCIEGARPDHSETIPAKKRPRTYIFVERVRLFRRRLN